MAYLIFNIAMLKLIRSYSNSQKIPPRYVSIINRSNPYIFYHLCSYTRKKIDLNAPQVVLNPRLYTMVVDIRYAIWMLKSSFEVLFKKCPYRLLDLFIKICNILNSNSIGNIYFICTKQWSSVKKNSALHELNLYSFGLIVYEHGKKWIFYVQVLFFSCNKQFYSVLVSFIISKLFINLTLLFF